MVANVEFLPPGHARGMLAVLVVTDLKTVARARCQDQNCSTMRPPSSAAGAVPVRDAILRDIVTACARLLPLTSLAVAVTVPAPRALAWNKPTHMIVGAIAYDVLKQDSPATIARVLELLKSHPEYDTRHALPDCADRRP
jgi:hypothetical protein